MDGNSGLAQRGLAAAPMMALGAGLAAVVAAWIAPAAEMRMAASVLAGCLLVLGLGLRLRLWLQSRAEARRIRLLAELVGLDATPCVMTTSTGRPASVSITGWILSAN